MHETINESTALIRHSERNGTPTARRRRRRRRSEKRKKKKRRRKERKRRKVWSKVTTFSVLFGPST